MLTFFQVLRLRVLLVAGLIAVTSTAAMLAPARAMAQCTNIAGNWNATETGTITLALNASDGESNTETDPVSGSGIVTITQTGPCTFQSTPIGLTGSSLINSGLTPSQLASLVRTVTVSGNNVTETGVFAVINTATGGPQGATITGTTGNVYTGTGQVSTANPPVMTLNGTGGVVISGTYSGYTFTLTYTASSTAVFTKENPIAITPPSQTSIASGLAYNGLFTATGGSGAPYTWCVLSGAAGSACLPSGDSASPLPAGFSMNQTTGVLSSTGAPLATQGSYSFMVQVTDSYGDMQPQAFTLVIGCATIIVYPYAGPPLSSDQPVPHPTQMEADFSPTDTNGNPLSLDDVAQACNFTGFNWQQSEDVLPTPQPISVCTSGILFPDGKPLANALCSFARTDPTQPLLGSIPYDPPQGGGYTYESYYDDAYPFYWSTTDFIDNQLLMTTYNLHFSDSPKAPVLNSDLQFMYNFMPTAPAKVFTTSLVGELACGGSGQPVCGTTGEASPPLVTWRWQSNFNGFFGEVGTAKNPNPVDPGSGTGGIMVMSINGVPTPTVTVTPLATDITSADGLAVTVAVQGASGSPTPTGSVTLTSGTYTSAVTILSGGSATINIPAGSLATGVDTVTAVYKPDNASAATFSFSSGSAQVTVTVPLLTPTVTVTPTSTSIVSAQQLPVTITVSGGSGNPTPTGTLVLSSGSYISSILSLSGGSASTTIPANSLAIGSVTLAADYSPDINSSSTYDSTFGTSVPVTVTQSPTTATPIFSVAPGTYATAQMVTITDSTPNAVIYYTTIGNTPTTGSPVYSGPISVSSTETLEAIAVASGDIPSAVASAAYTITPAFTGPGVQSVSAILPEQTQTITITGSGFGTQAAYSGNSNYLSLVDNTAGFSAGTGSDFIGLGVSSWTNTQIVISGFTGIGYGFFGALSAGDKVTISVSNPQTNAGPYTCTNIIVSAGQTTCGAIPEAATPTFSVAGGSYTSAQTVSVSDATAGATIYYTTNGAAPTASSTKYTGPITVSNTETLAAVATATGYSASVAGTATYTITSAISTATPTVTVTPALPNLPIGQGVTVTVQVSGANGSSTPTGLVTLTSGGYSSPDTDLNSGIANITIPAGYLTTGGNTLTARYAPDAASASAYSGASGSGSVTVVGQENAQNEWVWMGGSSSVNRAGMYGVQGIPAAGEGPGARYVSAQWTDANGNFWLFGGFGYDANQRIGDLNDLWEFNSSTNEWAWIGGSSSLPPTASSDPGYGGVYGTPGIPAVGISPGGRHYATTWTDNSGHLWLFGGEGYDGSGGYGFLNDLWEFYPSTNQWAWIGGSSTVGSINGQPGVYGTMGTPAAGNNPGGRFGASSWVDNGGHLWLFGGQGQALIGNYGQMNDLWEFIPSTNEWVWMGGSNTVDSKGGQPGVYGAQGTAAKGNMPGSRQWASTWTDSSGNLWLFGGTGYDASNSEGGLNDLWEFNPSSNLWTWVSGSETVGTGQPGVYGRLGTPAAGNTPGGRALATSWTDNNGNLWLFGGGTFNDLWEFSPTTRQWAWMAGSDVSNQSGAYGLEGISASTNEPGGRSGALGWTDSSGHLWLFGGDGIGTGGYSGDLNDLWVFLPTGSVSPGFTLAPSSSTLSVAQGNSSTDAITVTDMAGFTGAVSLTTSGLPSGVTAGFATNPTTGSSVLTLTASSTATVGGPVTVTINGTSGTLIASTTIAITVTPPPSFTLSPSGGTLSVAQSNSNTDTITVTGANGFTGSVTLAASGLPSGVTAGFAANPTTGSSVLTLTASSTTTTGGPVTVTITGTSGTLTASTTIALTVTPPPSFTLSPSVATLSVAQGSSNTDTVTVTGANGFTGSVTLAASGLPTGVTASFATNPTTGSSVLTLTSSSTATVGGPVTVTVKGTSGTLTASTTIALTVNQQPTFALAPAAGTLSVTQGGNNTDSITVTPSNGFTGGVTLSASGLPSGVTASFSPNPTTTGSGLLTFTANSTAATGGPVTVTITGTSGTLTETATVALTVNVAPGFTLAPSPGSVTVVQGNSGTSSIALTDVGGFNGAVTFAASGLATGVTASFSPNPISSGSSALTLTASSTATTGGPVTVTITGTSGTLTASTTIALNVTQPQSFTLSPSMATLSLVQGSSNTDTITVTGANGFTGAVALAVSGLPSGVTAGFATNPTTGSSVLTLTASTTATMGGPVTVTIKGTSGTLTASTTIALTVNPPSSFTLSPSAATLSVVQGSSSTDTITVTGANGFTGSVTLASTGLPSGVTASFATNPTTGSSVLTLTAGSTATVGGPATVTITGTSGTLTASTTIALTVNPPASFTLSPSAATLSVDQGNSNTDTISVTGANGFTGSVTLSASGLPSGVTAGFATNPTTGSSVLTLTASSTATVGGPVTVTITGTSGSLTASATIAVTVAAPPFTVTPSTTSVSIAPGATTGNTVTVTVTPANGFTGTVNLTCSISPLVANGPTCTLSPTSVTITGATAQTLILTVATTAGTSAEDRLKKLLWPSAGSTALALVLLIGVPRRRRNWLAMLGLLALFVSFGVMGCGGGSGNSGGGGGGGTTGTTAGTYTITVTGTSGTVTGTLGTVSLTVQ